MEVRELIDESKYYIFYDGECGFCNEWIYKILKNDKKDIFLFVSLQSDMGQSFLKERNLPSGSFGTLYLWKPDVFYYEKSQAVLKIAKLLGGKYAFLASLNIFPKFLADALYDQVAKRRKTFMSDACPIPTKQEREKFLR
ncbi:MAG: DUF393 domain-containing protein [Bergeyella sp.]|nr:DUF393 domain-containing protein [Bergeyella sp.]